MLSSSTDSWLANKSINKSRINKHNRNRNYILHYEIFCAPVTNTIFKKPIYKHACISC